MRQTRKHVEYDSEDPKIQRFKDSKIFGFPVPNIQKSKSGIGCVEYVRSFSTRTAQHSKHILLASVKLIAVQASTFIALALAQPPFAQHTITRLWNYRSSDVQGDLLSRVASVCVRFEFF